LGIEKFEIPSLEIKCLRCGMITPLFLNTEKQVILTDKNGKLLYVNSQFENVTGYKAKEVLGKTPAIWGGQMPVGFYKKLWHDISIKKRSVAVLLTNRKKNGDFYSVSLRISPILDVYGNIEVFLGIETLLKEKKI
jgi:PAS domain S-box-containing protein